MAKTTWEISCVGGRVKVAGEMNPRSCDWSRTMTLDKEHVPNIARCPECGSTMLRKDILD